MRRFQWPSIRRIMKRNLYQHNKISSKYFTSSPHTTCLDQITLLPPCAVLPYLNSYNYTSQGRQYSSFNNNNASIPDATQTAPSYAQYQLQLQLKLLQSRCFSSNHRGRGTRGRVPRMSEMKSLEEALTATYDNLERLSPRDVSAFWAVVPKFLGGRGPRTSNQQLQQQMFHQFDKISTKSIKDIDQYDPRDMSTLAISLAKIIDKVSKRKSATKGSPHQILQDVLIGNESKNKQHIFREIASSSVPILHEFNARELSNLIYSFGLAQEVVLVNDGSTLFDVFAQAAIPNLHKSNGQDLSNMLWAYANVKASNSQLFEHAGDSIVAMDNLNEFWPQALSNILWAYATLNEQHIQLFEKVGDAIVTMNSLDEFQPQALSNIIWAYATLDEQHPKLFKKVADHIVGLNNLSHFDSQALSNIIWAYTTLDEPHPNLFKKVAKHIVALDSLDRYDPQALSNLVWAYATLDEQNPMLFKKVADHIVRLDNLNSFNGQDCSNIVWAYATARESNPQLFKTLAEEAIKRQHEFIPQEIVNFLWAYASNGQIEEHLFSSFVPSVKANLDEYTAQGLSNVAWAYSVANVDAPSVFNNEFINACSKKENHFIPEALAQLHQWQLWQDEIKSDISLPLSLKKRCYEAFISQEFSPSKLQGNVVSSLLSMGLQPQEEVLMKSGYRIDAVVEVNGKQIAVEVDGPSHFVGKSRERTGSTILKHRQVAALDGMLVVSIPYWEWNKLKKDSKKKELYLRHSLGLK